jgi:hypothetical protein
MLTITNYLKVLSLLIAVLFLSNATQAQEKKTENFDQGFRLGFGINSGYAFQEPYHFSYGADLRIQYDLSERFSITLTSGYNYITINGNDNDLAFIPIKAGYKTFVWANKFYAMGEIGAAIGTTDTYRKTSVIVSPSVGYANKFIDVSIRYENYADFPNIKGNGSTGDGVGLVSVRLAYGFQL